MHANEMEWDSGVQPLKVILYVNAIQYFAMSMEQVWMWPNENRDGAKLNSLNMSAWQLVSFKSLNNAVLMMKCAWCHAGFVERHDLKCCLGLCSWQLCE